MKSIYYVDGVYVGSNSKDEKNCVWSESYRSVLYGGRVNVYTKNTGYYSANIYMKVDGIDIFSANTSSCTLNSLIGFESIVSHLNAIEIHGVDAFLENYKKNIEFVYTELKEIQQKNEFLLASEEKDYKIKNLLNEIKEVKDTLIIVLMILFNLSIHMNAGLENEKVISIYESIEE